jgi:hypothetical protein
MIHPARARAVTVPATPDPPPPPLAPASPMWQKGPRPTHPLP